MSVSKRGGKFEGVSCHDGFQILAALDGSLPSLACAERLVASELPMSC